MPPISRRLGSLLETSQVRFYSQHPISSFSASPIAGRQRDKRNGLIISGDAFCSAVSTLYIAGRWRYWRLLRWPLAKNRYCVIAEFGRIPSLPILYGWCKDWSLLNCLAQLAQGYKPRIERSHVTRVKSLLTLVGTEAIVICSTMVCTIMG